MVGRGGIYGDLYGDGREVNPELPLPKPDDYVVHIPKPSDWEVELCPGFTATPRQGGEPNWFHRWMHWLAFGFVWRKKQKSKG